MINVTKNGETKIYKAVEELKFLAKYNNGRKANSDRQQSAVEHKFTDRIYFGRGSKMEEDLDFFLSGKPCQPKKMYT